MAWQQFTSRGKGGKAKGALDVRPEIDQLAKELRSALMPQPHIHRSTGTRKQKPEWQCLRCTTMNFMDRNRCRWCGYLSPVAQAAPTPSVQTPPPRDNVQAQRLPPGSAWANGSPHQSQRFERPKANAKVKALEKAVEVAREAGATEDAIATLLGDIEAAKQEVADTRPLGARLDSARAQLAKAEAKVLAAEAAVAQAIERCNEAKAWRENAAASWSRLQQEVPRESFCLEPLVQGARNLLAQLEQSWVADPSTGQMPERILAGMKELHDALAASAPEQLPNMDTSSPAGDDTSPEASQGAEQHASKDSVDAKDAAEALLESLDGADMQSDVQLADILRKAAAARAKSRNGPY